MIVIRAHTLKRAAPAAAAARGARARSKARIPSATRLRFRPRTRALEHAPRRHRARSSTRSATCRRCCDSIAAQTRPPDSLAARRRRVDATARRQLAAAFAAAPPVRDRAAPAGAGRPRADRLAGAPELRGVHVGARALDDAVGRRRQARRRPAPGPGHARRDRGALRRRPAASGSPARGCCRSTSDGRDVSHRTAARARRGRREVLPAGLPRARSRRSRRSSAGTRSTRCARACAAGAPPAARAGEEPVLHLRPMGARDGALRAFRRWGAVRVRLRRAPAARPARRRRADADRAARARRRCLPRRVGARRRCAARPRAEPELRAYVRRDSAAAARAAGWSARRPPLRLARRPHPAARSAPGPQPRSSASFHSDERRARTPARARPPPARARARARRPRSRPARRGWRAPAARAAAAGAGASSARREVGGEQQRLRRHERLERGVQPHGVAAAQPGARAAAGVHAADQPRRGPPPSAAAGSSSGAATSASASAPTSRAQTRRARPAATSCRCCSWSSTSERAVHGWAREQLAAERHAGAEAGRPRARACALPSGRTPLIEREARLAQRGGRRVSRVGDLVRDLHGRALPRCSRASTADRRFGATVQSASTTTTASTAGRSAATRANAHASAAALAAAAAVRSQTVAPGAARRLRGAVRAVVGDHDRLDAARAGSRARRATPSVAPIEASSSCAGITTAKRSRPARARGAGAAAAPARPPPAARAGTR